MSALGTLAVILRPSWTMRSWQILLESDWFSSGFSCLPLPLPLPQLRAESQPYLHFDGTAANSSYSLPHKVYIHLCGILFKFCQDLWPKKRRWDWRGSSGATTGIPLGSGDAQTPRRMRFCLLLEVRGPKERENCQGPKRKAGKD